ncbi:MAG: PDZ domain-containing protein [Firmicutes bacterium]|nr:PDZ domain-containing protein [Bacillota bacterium]
MNRKQQRTKTVARILAVIVALAMIMMSGYYLLLAFSAGSEVFYVYAGEETPETIEKNLKKIDLLREVVQYIDENYADDVTVEELADAAYNGVFDALDQWSVYYKTKEEKDAFINQVTGNYAGIGVTMTLDGEGRCVITQVNTLGPAYEAGIKTGMIIVSVDGAAVKGKTLDEISTLVRGEPGTTVELQLELDGASSTVSVARRNIKAQTVAYQMLEDKIGYISISQFSGDTWKEFRTAKIDLLGQGMEALIVDLRNNGGGVMGDALSIASMLIEAGKPLVFFEQQGEIIDEYYSEGNGFRDVPLAVLINNRTASASECLAAAIKDNAAGTLIGETSYGKGVAQELVTMDNGDSFKLTFCHFLTPLKQRIDGVGIVPDIAVSNGAQLSAAQIEALEKELLPIEEGKKYFAGQVGLTVLAIQQRLNIIGYDVDENARMDEKTVEALKRIQALYGAGVYGGLDFCTIDLVQRAYREFIEGDGTDKQLLKAIEVLK